MNLSQEDQQKVDRLIDLDDDWPHSTSARAEEYKQLIEQGIAEKARAFIASKIRTSGEGSLRGNEISYFKQYRNFPELRDIQVSQDFNHLLSLKCV